MAGGYLGVSEGCLEVVFGMSNQYYQSWKCDFSGNCEFLSELSNLVRIVKNCQDLLAMKCYMKCFHLEAADVATSTSKGVGEVEETFCQV